MNRQNQSADKPALIIVDMVKDNLNPDHPFPITPLAMQLISPINTLIDMFRKQAWPVVFSTDAFHEDDFIFRGRMKPHSLAGTRGAEIADGLDYRPEIDTWLPKPRFSSFQTGLEDILNEQKSYPMCSSRHHQFLYFNYGYGCPVHDFKVILLEDCTAASPESIHEKMLSIYRRNPLYPLLQIASAKDMNKLLF